MHISTGNNSYLYPSEYGKLIAWAADSYRGLSKPIIIVPFKGKVYKPLNLIVINAWSTPNYSDNNYRNGYITYQLADGSLISKVDPKDIVDAEDNDYVIAIGSNNDKYWHGNYILGDQYSDVDAKDPIRTFANGYEFSEYLHSLYPQIEVILE